MALTKITGEGVGAVDSLTVDTNTLHVDSTNNNVGIGTTSVEDFGGGHVTLEVAGSTTTQGGVFKTATSDSAGSGSSGTEMIMFTDSTNGGSVNVVTSDSLRFLTANTERGRFLAGGGLTFNGDTATANALDDYEEGDWTPDLQDGGGDSYTGSYAARLGKYTKVGNMVTVWAQINATNSLDTHGLTGGEGLQIHGLPFTALNDSGATSYAGSSANVNSINFPSGYTQITPAIGKGSGHMVLKLAGDNVGDVSLTCTQYQAGEIFLCVNYRAT